MTENRARLLHAERKLQEHPKAVEATELYAACRDGRRWIGRHILTGPMAGTVGGPLVGLGPLVDGEKRFPYQRLIRRAVGIDGHRSWTV